MGKRRGGKMGETYLKRKRVIWGKLNGRDGGEIGEGKGGSSVKWGEEVRR